MKSGHVKWDDEDMNKNSGRGTLPDGEYGKDTIIFYCCQSQGSWHDSLELPIDHPFYLLPCKSESFNSPRCQQVKWALSKLEYIIYDTQDGRNGDALFGNHVFAIKSHPSLLTVYYCYYESKYVQL